MAIMDMGDMAIMDIMERERLRLNQDITMDIPITEVMVTMDIMARGKLRHMLLLSPVITIMVMMVMVIMVMKATIYLFKNFSKLKRVSLNLVKRCRCRATERGGRGGWQAAEGYSGQR